ncbi:MAG: tetratricopeptide repeat protein [Alphaproteobacteria bacterium]|nr:tetratricopeptide repeat protein [Alphaproteobacteria bacterium]
MSGVPKIIAGLGAVFCLIAPIGLAFGQSVELTRLHQEGAAYYKAGDFKAAIPITEQALVLSEREFGPNGSRTGFVLRNLASLKEKVGDFRAAEPLYRRAAAILSASLGANHAVVRETDAQAVRAADLARRQPVTRERIELTPPPAIPRRTSRKTLGWSVQLGAFRQLDNAHREAKILGVALADVLDRVSLEIRETLDGSQRFYRVRTLALRDRKTAKRLCARIKAKGRPCFLIK